MATNEKLSKSPIREAALKVGFEVKDEMSWDSLLEKVIDVLKEEYPIINKRVLFRAKDSSVQNIIQDGYLLSDKSRNRRVQIRKGNLEIYKVQPYVEWDELFADFARIIYLLEGVIFIKPIVKYSNLFHLNVSQSDEIEDFLTMKVIFPSSIPAFSEKLNFKINMSDDREGNIVYDIEQMIEATDNNEKPVRVKLNINVESRNYISPSVEELFQEFLKLRVCKNKLFFSLITERAKSNFI